MNETGWGPAGENLGPLMASEAATEDGGAWIRPLGDGDAEVCEGILRSLPDWFGIEEAIVSYRRDIEEMETYVACSPGGITGFLTLGHHGEHSSEIQVMAVRRECHGLGIGRALVEHAERLLHARAVEYLEVKTLGPSRECASYQRTRGFYRAMGFLPVEESSKIWDEANPCLIQVKHLRCASAKAGPLPEYRYRGARAMVMLHEKRLRSFLAVWRRARRAGVVLPPTDDPDYASPGALLAHVCACARKYMVWFCEVLDLPDPGIRPAPAAAEVEAEAASYLDHVLLRWRSPLAGVEEERFFVPEHLAPWRIRVRYCVDAMLEHAVMHPIRHEFQLREMLEDDPR